MARLLEDATKLSGVEYDINNLKDVYEAIHVIQEDLGIAGTTVKEASTTISGSMGMMKASAENLLVALADPEADISEYIDNLVESTGTFAENLLPIVEESVVGVAELIEELFPVMMERIPETIGGETLSSLVESGINIIMALIEGIQSNLSLITGAALEISMMLSTSLLEMLPLLLELGLQVIVQLALGIAQSLPELIPTTIEIILQLVDVLLSNLDLLIDAGIELILALATGLIERGLPLLIDKAPLIIEKLLDAIIKNTPKLVDAALKICLTIGQGILDSADRIIEKAPQLLDMLVKKFEDYKQASLDIGSNIVQGIWDGISMSYTWIQNKLAGWVDDVIGWIQKKLGIHSPSTVMRDKVGKFMGQGVWVGFDEEDPMTSIENSISRSWNGLQNNFKATATSTPINYTKLGNAMADSLVKSGLTIKVGDREFGRVVREVVVYG